MQVIKKASETTDIRGGLMHGVTQVLRKSWAYLWGDYTGEGGL